MRDRDVLRLCQFFPMRLWREIFAGANFFVETLRLLRYAPRSDQSHNHNSEALMWKAAIVGALALTMGMTSFVAAETLGAPQHHNQTAGQSGPLIREAHIARLRSALNLKPEQQRYWAPVESALRALARQQAREGSSGGFVQRVSDRASAVAGTAVQLRRLASAATPLIRSLDERQKSTAMAFVHSAGFGHLAAAF